MQNVNQIELAKLQKAIGQSIIAEDGIRATLSLLSQAVADIQTMLQSSENAELDDMKYLLH
ncbi:MAG: hypothetical protein ACI9JN_001600 [Bacteroidia bacterium]|jgi:hypothetical protein